MGASWTVSTASSISISRSIMGGGLKSSCCTEEEARELFKIISLGADSESKGVGELIML